MDQSRENEEKIVEYFEKAALQEPKCFFFLGEMYEKGKKVASNPEKAIKYYTLASEKGVIKATVNLAFLYFRG
jgi:uncharacterized protein